MTEQSIANQQFNKVMELVHQGCELALKAQSLAKKASLEADKVRRTFEIIRGGLISKLLKKP